MEKSNEYILDRILGGNWNMAGSKFGMHGITFWDGPPYRLREPLNML